MKMKNIWCAITLVFVLILFSSASLAQDSSISELRDTFWHLKQLQGSTTNVAGVVVRVQIFTPDGSNASITFSTPSYFISIPFVYGSTGLEFHPAYAHSENGKYPQDEQAGRIFDDDLKKSCCYELHNGILTFVDKGRHSLVVLGAVQEEGIENRRWRIARYRAIESKSTPKDELVDAAKSADIIFMNGRVSGSSGCGALVGTYAVSGDNLISVVGRILAGLCTSEHLVQGSLVERDLKGDRQIEKDGKNILLRDKNGVAMILLVPN